MANIEVSAQETPFRAFVSSNVPPHEFLIVLNKSDTFQHLRDSIVKQVSDLTPPGRAPPQLHSTRLQMVAPGATQPSEVTFSWELHLHHPLHFVFEEDKVRIITEFKQQGSAGPSMPPALPMSSAQFSDHAGAVPSPGRLAGLNPITMESAAKRRRMTLPGTTVVLPPQPVMAVPDRALVPASSANDTPGSAAIATTSSHGGVPASASTSAGEAEELLVVCGNMEGVYSVACNTVTCYCAQCGGSQVFSGFSDDSSGLDASDDGCQAVAAAKGDTEEPRSDVEEQETEEEDDEKERVPTVGRGDLRVEGEGETRRWLCSVPGCKRFWYVTHKTASIQRHYSTKHKGVAKFVMAYKKPASLPANLRKKYNVMRTQLITAVKNKTGVRERSVALQEFLVGNGIGEQAFPALLRSELAQHEQAASVESGKTGQKASGRRKTSVQGLT